MKWLFNRQKLTGTNFEEDPVLVELEDGDLDQDGRDDYIALSSCEGEGLSLIHI